MKRKIISTVLAIVCGLTGVLQLSSCSRKTVSASKDLMANIKPAKQIGTNQKPDSARKLLPVSLHLLQENYSENNNTLISPLSVASAMGMTTNGAKGETLAQLEDVFGLNIDELNQLLGSYKESLGKKEQEKLQLANAIWMRTDIAEKVKPEFLQTNADYYNAGVYAAAFDEKTKNDINNFVRVNTKERIPSILEKVSSSDTVYLVNALAFQDKWDKPYEKTDIEEGIFTTAQGEQQNVSFLHSTENTYYEDAKAIGVSKPYADGRYAFVGILPKEGISLYEYIAALTGEELTMLLQSAGDHEVITGIPEFKTEFTADLSETFQKLGATDAFSTQADFSAMAGQKGDLMISNVLHKTYIEVDAEGTKAAAATLVTMKETAMPIDFEEPKTVYLDRPFLYMIVDQTNQMPIFIGTQTSIK